MMEIQIQFILTVCIVVSGMTSVQPTNKIKDQFQNLFDSIAKNNTEQSEMYHGILKQEAVKEHQAFDAVKLELQIAQMRNVNRRNNLHMKRDFYEMIAPIKREVNESDNTIDQSEMGTLTTTDDPYIPPNKTSGYHRALLQEFAEVFSEGDPEKKNILLFATTDLKQKIGMSVCYFKIFETFKSHCLYYFYQLRTVGAFQTLFQRLCDSNWLETEVIEQMIKKTCAEKPYLMH